MYCVLIFQILEKYGNTKIAPLHDTAATAIMYWSIVEAFGLWNFVVAAFFVLPCKQSHCVIFAILKYEYIPSVGQ